MSTKLVVDDHSQLQEIRTLGFPKQPQYLRILARIVSYVFHPIFIPVYVAWFLINVQPYLFVSFDEWKKLTTMIQFVVMYALFPMVTVLLLKGLGFISSVFLKTQKDRIIPYVVCMIYYFWVWMVLKNQFVYPPAIVQFALSIFIASIFGLMANIYMKISMHAMAAGVLIAFMVLLAFSQAGDFGIYVSVALVVAGLICTSRFIVSDHTQGEVYWGLIFGIISQLLANWFT
jgi:hypothetical protein